MKYLYLMILFSFFSLPSTSFAVVGVLNAQGCEIPQGEFACNMHITGSVQGGVGPFVYVDDVAIPGLLNWTWGPENANGPIDRNMLNFYKGPGNYLFTLVDAGLSIESTAIVVCTPGTNWDGSTCVGPPINGVCGIANGGVLAVAPAPADLCSVGVASPVAGAGPWTWSCAGKFGGAPAFCSANPPPPIPNASPVADAGVDFEVQLPQNIFKLLGTASDAEDPPGALIISWSKVTGPGAPVFDNQNILQPNITFAIAGIYTFRLTVKDTGGKMDTDDVVVTVKAAPAGCPATTIGGCTLGFSGSGISVPGTCGAGFTGSCNYTCNSGTWTPTGGTAGMCTVAPPGCPLVTNKDGCRIDKSPDGASAVGDCISPQYSGNCAYNCSAGTWQEVVNNCSPVPMPPVNPDPGVIDGESNLIPCGLKQNPATKIVSDPCEFKHFIELAKNIIDFLIFKIASALAAIMFAYAGYLFITNNGNEGQIKQAKDIFLYVFWGYVIALGAWLAVNMLLSFFVDDKYNFLK